MGYRPALGVRPIHGRPIITTPNRVYSSSRSSPAPPIGSWVDRGTTAGLPARALKRRNISAQGKRSAALGYGGPGTEALKGRNNRDGPRWSFCRALSGLGGSPSFVPGRRLAARPPRLPWADMSRPFGAEPGSESAPRSSPAPPIGSWVDRGTTAGLPARALKGRNISAQGKRSAALGYGGPGTEALKGRNNRDGHAGHSVAPFQGLAGRPHLSQGDAWRLGRRACPGLICHAPSGLSPGANLLHDPRGPQWGGRFVRGGKSADHSTSDRDQRLPWSCRRHGRRGNSRSPDESVRRPFVNDRGLL